MHDFTPFSALLGGALIGLASVWLLAAVVAFMATGMIAAYVTRHLLGVAS